MIHATLVIIGLVVTSVILGILLGVQLRDWQHGQVHKIEKELRDIDKKHSDIIGGGFDADVKNIRNDFKNALELLNRAKKKALVNLNDLNLN